MRNLTPLTASLRPVAQFAWLRYSSEPVRQAQGGRKNGPHSTRLFLPAPRRNRRMLPIGRIARHMLPPLRLELTPAIMHRLQRADSPPPRWRSVVSLLLVIALLLSGTPVSLAAFTESQPLGQGWSYNVTVNCTSFSTFAVQEDSSHVI